MCYHYTNPPFEPPAGLEPATIWLQIRSSTKWAKGAIFYFTKVESIDAESQQAESTQVVSVVVVSVEVEVVSFEQEAKVTRAAIINRFFMFFINIYFLIFSTWDGNRTRTDITVYWILSPARLPIPPPKQF